MKLEYYLESFALLITVVAFIIEYKLSEKETNTILWVTFFGIVFLLSIFVSIGYFHENFIQIKLNSESLFDLNNKITNFEKELNIRQSLELINYKIGELEGRKR